MNHRHLKIVCFEFTFSCISKCLTIAALFQVYVGVRKYYAPFSKFPQGRYEDSAGLAFDTFKCLARRLNWTVNVTIPPNAVPGGPVGNGSYNGLVGMLFSGELDIVIGPFTITYTRSQAIDFTYPLYEDPTGILIPPPRPEPKVWACTQPYTPEVWLGLIGCLVILPFLLWFILRISRNGSWVHTASYPGLQKQFDFVIGVLLSQSGTCFVNTHASRTLATAWCLASVILVNVYTSILVSYLTIPKQNALVDSIEDVATKGVVALSLLKSTSFDTLMLTATEGTYKLLGDSLRRRPETRVSALEEGVTKVLGGKHAFIMDKSILDDVVYEDYKQHASCRLTLAKNSFFKSYVAFMVPKRSPYLKSINREMIRFHEAGLISYWSARSLPPPNPCVVMKTGIPQSANLKLDDIQSAFVVYGIGNLAAIIIFAIETLSRLRKRLRDAGARRKKGKENFVRGESHTRM